MARPICEEDGCGTPLDPTDDKQRLSRLCEKCLAVAEADEINDRMTFADVLGQAFATGTYNNLFDAIKIKETH